MPAPDPRIAKFIRRHHVLTLATCADGHPWCSNMFYAYLELENLFVFTSDEGTRHVAEARANRQVAGSVVLETKVVGKLQGLQLTGTMRLPEEEEAQAVRAAYLRRFPYAAVANLQLWVLEPFSFKLTDNTLGFGKKLRWERDNSAKKD